MAMAIMAAGPAFGHPSRRRYPQMPHSHPALEKTEAFAYKGMRPLQRTTLPKNDIGEWLNVAGLGLPAWPHKRVAVPPDCLFRRSPARL